MDDIAEQQRLMELFGYGRAGEPVPVVDPEDVRAVWEITQESGKGHQGGIMIGREIFRHACKPGANVPAVTYRTRKIDMLRMIAPEVMEPLLKDKFDAVFRAVAEIPMEWIGTDVRHGLPFDRDDFIRRVRARSS
jgi:hypothetical protein